MQAVILAAGMGKRLKDLTRDNTKCMVKVNGVTLIERMLRQLDDLSLEQIVIVIGYRGDDLRDYISTLDIRTKITYVSNPVYDTTNNIYSLYLAKDHLLNDDTLLLESDLIFEDKVLDILISDKRDTVALVDKYESWMDGTCVVINSDDEITRFVPSTKFKYSECDKYYKTVNIYKFSRVFSEKLYVPFLEAYSKALGNNEYYEQVLRVITMLDHPEIKALRLSGQKWYEIDDVQDLDIASSMFNNTKTEKFRDIQGRFGGYWRYPSLMDFTYANNPFFPTSRMTDEIKANLTKVMFSYPSKNQINSLLVAKNLSIKESQVVVSNGIEELFGQLLEKVSEPVGMVAPPNLEYLHRLQNRSVDLFRSSDMFNVTSDDIISHYAQSGIKTLILVNPNAYTGALMPIGEITKLVDWCSKNNIVTIIDETDIEYAVPYDESVIGSGLFESYDGVICLKNISSVHGVSGLRVGCAVSANTDFIDALRKDISIWNINSVAEFYLQIEEKHKKAFIASTQMVREEAARVIGELNKISGIKVFPTRTANLLCSIDQDVMSAMDLASELTDRFDILVKVVPSEVIDGNLIRISLRDPDSNNKLISAMKRVLTKNSADERISGKSVHIDDETVHSFFEERTSKKLPHRYNYVIYQDSNPDLALERDAYEKKKMLPLLDLRSDSRVLDIGCGVGRWGDAVVKVISDGRYVGVDYSKDFLEIAKENLPSDKCRLLSGSFQELSSILESSGETEKYNAILINGVLMYLNDEDLISCMKTAADLLKENGVVYIKESVGYDERLTLKDFYSNELSHSYSAIYRSLSEYNAAISEVFPSDSFEVVEEGETWKTEHKNRKDTTSWYWIVRRKTL